MPDARGNVDVLVIGAGPTGLMAATLLARCGVGVRLVDRNPDQAHESRAFGIQARSMELFLSLGLADRVLAEGALAAGIGLWIGGREAAAIDIADIGREDTPFPFLLMLPQSRIEAILSEDVAAQGVRIERGVEAVALAQGPDGVDVDLRDVKLRDADGAPARVRARYVIGADGAHSFVRHALGLSFAGAAYPQGFLLADCRVDWALPHDRLTLFLSGRRFGGFLPLKGAELARIIVATPEEGGEAVPVAQQGSAPATLPEVEAAFRAATGIDVTLHDAAWLSRYRVHHRGVDRYREGRVFVAGDAAHIHSPAGGQGMNTGLQDAANLAWKIGATLRGGAPATLLDSYHAERWPVGQRVLEETDRMFTGLTDQGDVKAFVRNRLLPLFAGALARSGALRARAFHFVSQLGIRYEPGEDLAEASAPDAGAAWRRGPGPGRRAPDARIARQTSVFDLIAAYGFHVLAFAREPLPEDALARLHAELAALPRIGGAPVGTAIVAQTAAGRDPRLVRAEGGGAFAAYGLDRDTPNGLYLIRPDGYVAWRADRHDIAGLARFARARFGEG